MSAPGVLREAMRWIVPVIVVLAMSITFAQAQPRGPQADPQGYSNLPTTAAPPEKGAAGRSENTSSIGATSSQQAAIVPCGAANLSDLAPAPDRPVLHLKCHLAAEGSTPMPNGGATNETWVDTAAGQGRYEDIMYGPGATAMQLHTVKIYDRQSILSLDLLKRVGEKESLPKGKTPAPAFGKKGFEASLACGDSELVGTDVVDGRAAIKVKPVEKDKGTRSDGKPPESKIVSVEWLDAETFLPIKAFTYSLNTETGAMQGGVGSVFDIAEWIPRSSLPADFFDQTMPEGFKNGPVIKG